MNDWVAVAICIAVGLIAGSIAGRIVRSQLAKPTRPEAVQLLAVPAASLVFTVVLIAGLMSALGIVDPDALADLPTALVNYLPKGLSAAVILLAGNAVSQLAATTVSRSASGATGVSADRVGSATRIAILAGATILAASQAGIDTTIINIASAALFASIGLAVALLVGLGSRDVAEQIAAGRALRSIVRPGDAIEIGELRGRVVAVHPVALEVERPDGHVVVVPHAQLLDERLLIDRP